MKRRIYLDHNASTPVDPRVIEVVEDHLRNQCGNSASIHAFGRECRQRLTLARDSIASYLNVRSDEIIFTSGATEGANMVVRGLFHDNPSGHIITSSVEHSCVYNTVKELGKRGCEVTFLDPGPWGAIKPEAVEKALKPDTKLIAIMAANNETGVKTDFEAIAGIAYEANVPFFVDAVALLGKETLQVPEGVSAMCFSGHKFHATQGVGFVFVRRPLKFTPLIIGGSHQYGKRAGTENLPGIVGLEKAISLLREELPEATKHMKNLRDGFEKGLQDQLSDLYVNGEGPRVVNTSNLCFSGVDGETLLCALDMEGIAASHGSACASGSLEPSRVLLNMGLSPDRVNASLRFSISRLTTQEEIDSAIEAITKIVKKLRSLKRT